MHPNLTSPPGLIDALRAAHAVTVLTGAGISAESGLPTFRNPTNGIWSRFRLQDVATTAVFRANPALVWACAPVAYYRGARQFLTLLPDGPLRMSRLVDEG